MPSISRIPYIQMLLLIAMAALTPVTVLAQGLQLAKVDSSRDDKSAKFSFEFNQDVSLFSNSKLIFVPITRAGARYAEDRVPLRPVTGEVKKAAAEILLSSLKPDTYKIEYRAEILDANNAPLSQTSWMVLNIGDLAELQGTLTEANNKISTLTTNLETVTKERDEREQALKNFVQKTQAMRFNSTVIEFITDEKIAVTFTLNTAGKIRARIVNDPAAPGPVPISKSWQSYLTVSPAHTVVFDGLPKRQSYLIEAEILKISDDTPTGVKLDFTLEPKLRVATVESIDPIILLEREAKAEGEFLAVKLKPNVDAYVQIRYYEIIDSAKGQYGSDKFKNRIKTSDFGKPDGVLIKAGPESTSVVLDEGIKPGKKYGMEITAFNLHGRKMGAAISLEATASDNVSLSFSPERPIGVELDPLRGVVLTWKANIKPDKAYFKAQFDGQTYGVKEILGSEIKDDLIISLALPVDDFAKLLGAATKDDAQKKKERPILIAGMIDPRSKKPMEQGFRISFTLPTVGDIKKSNLTPSAQEEMLKVVENAVDGKSVNWTRLLKSGLSILFKVAI